MAKDKSKPETDTMAGTRILEVKGKIVENIEVTVTSNYHGIAINFSDKTAMVFNIMPCIAMFPYYGVWKIGDCQVIKEFYLFITIFYNPQRTPTGIGLP